MQQGKQHKVGLTGGIGAGKSLVADVFQVLGVPVYHADSEARIMMETDETLRAALQKNFGKEVFIEGVLQRKYLASRVFSDKEALRKLNSIVHPRLFQAFIHWAGNQNSRCVIIEAAVLFGSGAERFVDSSVFVSAPLELRIQRVMERDQCLREEVMNRINNQLPADEMEKLADYCLVNDGNHLIVPQVVALYNTLHA